MALESLEQPTTTRTPLYEGSTQFKNWRFSKEQLLQIRTSLNLSAVAAIRNAFEADTVRLTVESNIFFFRL